MKNSKFIQIVWNINGVIILLAAIIGIFILFIQIYSEISANNYEYNKGVIVDEPKKNMKKLGFDAQHLLYDSPTKIPFSDYYYSQVYVMDKEIPQKILDQMKLANDISRDWFGGTINVIFFNSKTEDAYVLLEDFGFITTINIPYKYVREEISDNNKRKYILYRISLEDSNNDGRINRKDNSAYYISDLSGKNLKRITPLNIDFERYWIDDENNNLIYFEELTKESEKDQYGFLLKTRTLYRYNIENNEFKKFEKFQNIFDSLQVKFNSN